MNKYNRFLLHASFYRAESVCIKSVIQSGRSLFLSKIKNTLLKLPVGVSPLQLVNLHRNRRYFVINLHTWFCLSYFLKTNIKLYCIYQYFMSINSFFNTVSVSRYSRPITVTRDPLQHVLPVFFLIMLFNNIFKPAFQIFFQTGTMIFPNKFRVSTFNKLQLLSLYFYI